MEQYINKAALVAEIEKRRDKNARNKLNLAAAFEDNYLLSFLESLEVKEVHDIWHDVSEKPELEQPLLIVTNGTHKHFRRRYRIGCYGKRGNDIPTWVIAGCYSDSFISKWCYISDILQYAPEVKEMDSTDAFIEKACEWLYLQLNEINMEGKDMENFLKDFNNYMKGE